MIIQCTECQTRFRLADEKIKPTGTRVRCSRCKHVFTVTPAEPEPAAPEEAVDFGDFNMEKVAEPTATPPATPALPAAVSPEEQPKPSPGTFDDENRAAAEWNGEDGPDGGDSAGGFSFGTPTQTVQDSGARATAALEDDKASASADADSLDFDRPDVSADTAGEPGWAADVTEAAEAAAFARSFEIGAPAPRGEEPGEFDFTGEPPGQPETAQGDAPEMPADTGSPGDFTFAEEADHKAFSFDEEPAAADAESSAPEPPEFNFETAGQEVAFNFEDETDSIAWDEGPEHDGPAFDFDEPRFETKPAAMSPPGTARGLQFGEIDLADEAGADQRLAADVDFASTEPQEEAQTPRPKDIKKAASAERGERTSIPLPPVKPTKRKSPMASVLLLLVLLLLALGGAAGYLYWQDGGLDLHRIGQRFPFLQPYLGETVTIAEGPQIGISIASSTYVNNRSAGQLLVVQGEAVNNYPAARSAITLKGILLDDKGRVLLQQTVFCGNPLSTEALQTLPFSNIEEAMNNQFGASLSNMNVAAGARIPFTVVFRNLPEGIANINIEVVESKPGSS